MTKGISVVVATRNRSHLLEALVTNVLGQAVEADLELVVVDDGSTDDTWDTLQRLATCHQSLQIIRLPERQGPATARNTGWRAARGTLIVFTDDDCAPQPGWLAALTGAHVDGLDIVQGKTIPDPESWPARSAFSHWIEVDTFSGRYETCNISYRAEALRSLSGFDEAFGVSRGGAPFGEDTDLGWRAREAGMSAAFEAEAVVVHAVSESSYTAFLRARLRRHRIVFFLRRHPDYRARLWRRYFFERSHPPALILFGGLAVVSIRRNRLAPVMLAAAATPYVRYRTQEDRVAGLRRYWPLTIPGMWVADIVEIGVLAAGSVRWRTPLL
jgi:glycosyltransferase involved in cell wall biosynthesis